MIGELREVLKRLYHSLEVMQVCALWYAAYPFSLRQIEEITLEGGVFVDHTAGC
jgi:putative transposase